MRVPSWLTAPTRSSTTCPGRAECGMSAELVMGPASARFTSLARQPPFRVFSARRPQGIAVPDFGSPGRLSGQRPLMELPL